jgi:hypothetical protein
MNMDKRTDGIGWRKIGVLILALLIASIGLTLWLGSLLELSISDHISLGQLVIAIILIPLAVVGFWEARHTILHAAAKPKLRFAFLGEEGLLYDEYVISLPAVGGHANRVTFAVENTGNAIAVWWQVSFDLPVEMMEKFEKGEGNVRVRKRQVTLMMDTVGNVRRYVGQSAGTVGLFPGPPTQVAIIDVAFDALAYYNLNDIEAEYPISFEILTDKTSPFRGEIPLKVEIKDASAN